jgi:hypothetical protein
VWVSRGLGSSILARTYLYMHIFLTYLEGGNGLLSRKARSPTNDSRERIKLITLLFEPLTSTQYKHSIPLTPEQPPSI